jgi:hypothetical protein
MTTGNPERHEVLQALIASRQRRKQDDVEIVKEIFEEAFPQIEGDSNSQVSESEALDKTLLSEKGEDDAGGYAFLWSDVLVLEELIPLLHNSLSDPNQVVPLLKQIFTMWQKIREIRVPLSDNQYRVLSCVKSGISNPRDIASSTGLLEVKVMETLNELKVIEYGENGLTLVNQDKDAWSTEF